MNQTNSKTIDGVTYTCTHAGQKRRYGDSFYEYDVTSDLPADQVEKVCAEKVNKAIPYSEWKAEARDSLGKYFRNHYSFTNVGEGTYRYVVTSPYAD